MKYVKNLECDWCEEKVLKKGKFVKIEFRDNEGEDPNTGIFHASCAARNKIGRRDHEKIIDKGVNG